MPIALLLLQYPQHQQQPGWEAGPGLTRDADTPSTTLTTEPTNHVPTQPKH